MIDPKKLGKTQNETKPVIHTGKLSGSLIDYIRQMPKDYVLRFALEQAESEYRNGQITYTQYEQKVVNYENMAIEDMDYIVQVLNYREIITVIDSIMGSGKTTFILNMIKQNPGKKYLCVVPTLKLCEEYRDGLNGESRKRDNKTFELLDWEEKKNAAKNKDEYDTKISEPQSFKPRNKDGEVYAYGSPKLKHFKKLISEGKNIVTTHALLRNIDDEAMRLLSMDNYTLVIDEAFDAVKEFNYKCKVSDWKQIEQMTRINPKTALLEWTDETHDGRYSDIRRLCDTASLVVARRKDGTLPDKLVGINSDGKLKMTAKIIWQFPPEFFGLFEHCYICTYMFEGSFQSYYFKMHGIKYYHMAIGNNHKLVPYSTFDDRIRRAEVGNLITIYQGKMNNVGDPYYYRTGKNGGTQEPLCKTWYDREDNKPYVDTVRKNLSNWLNETLKDEWETKNNAFWTNYKNTMSKIMPKGFKKKFLSCNAMGTNDYREAEAVGYTINLIPPTNLVNFFKCQGIEVNEDLWSLTMMLQFIWRSRIRNADKPQAERHIYLYAPSKRMRELLINWMNGERIG